MPPTPPLVPLFAAESPQEPLPYGRWAEALGEQFCAAPIGREYAVEAADIAWFPERTWTAAPTCRPPRRRATARCSATSPTRASTRAQATDFVATADFTEETAEQNPDWTLDLSDEEIGQWRGTEGPARRGDPGVGRGAGPERRGGHRRAGPTTTDQCEPLDNRFTLVSVDAYTGDYVEVRLYGARGAELARESLYEDE